MNLAAIGVNAAYFHRDGLLSAVRKLTDIGVKKVELNGLALTRLAVDEFRTLVKTMKHECLQCISINTAPDLIPVNLGNLAAFNKRERDAAVTHVGQCLDYAEELACPAVVCDVGSSTEDLQPQVAQDDCYFRALEAILKHACKLKKRVVLLNVPGRRWTPWDELPPDRSRVVERHVWPWRRWLDEEEVVANVERRFRGKVQWAFDTANAMVASGSMPLNLRERVGLYLRHDLGNVYLANHPGPYNRVWHRLLLHRPLNDGFFSRNDYRLLLQALHQNNFDGEIILQIAECEPSAKTLQRNLGVVAKLRFRHRPTA
ncbi:MAG: sugar phosphate isomerase/epimerase [Verrucomicrobia bacterium]|nr:sugar phosphate isomerase/epimerase [Verrucomicrobiota bacterium]